jgi:exosome complex RNA-binding protein Rrp42 (RNase PH superfamily)
MADTKRPGIQSSSKSKRQAKNAAAEDPFATAKVRAIFDPEETDLVNAKLEEIQSSGATITIAASVEGSIERIISVGGSPETVGKVCKILSNC